MLVEKKACPLISVGFLLSAWRNIQSLIWSLVASEGLRFVTTTGKYAQLQFQLGQTLKCRTASHVEQPIQNPFFKNCRKDEIMHKLK